MAFRVSPQHSSSKLGSAFGSCQNSGVKIGSATSTCFSGIYYSSAFGNRPAKLFMTFIILEKLLNRLGFGRMGDEVTLPR